MYDESNWFLQQKRLNKQKLFYLQIAMTTLGIVFLGIGMIFAEPNIMASAIQVRIR